MGCSTTLAHYRDSQQYLNRLVPIGAYTRPRTKNR